MPPIRAIFAFLLVSTLVVVFVFSPVTSLLAQDPLPTPTIPYEPPDTLLLTPDSIPTPTIPYDQLPICPEMTTIDGTKSPLEGNSNSAPVCRIESTLLVDVRELIEQGIDPITVGVGGDATSGSPTPVSPTSNHQQTTKLYLPMMQGNTSSRTSSANPVQLDDDSAEPYPGYVPFDQLPECPPFVINPSIPTPVADFSDNAPRCRVTPVDVTDVRALIEQGVDIRELGLSGDAQESEGSILSPLPSPIPVFNGESTQ